MSRWPVDIPERRDFLRMIVEAKLMFRRHGEDAPHQGRTLNLSANGIRFSTRDRVDESESLQIEIVPERNSIDPLVAVVEVIRVEAQGDGAYVVAGEMKDVR